MGIEGTAPDSTLASVFKAGVTVAVLQIGMKRVTTTNPARYLCIDKSGKTNCTIRIIASCFNARKRKILGLRVGEARLHPPSQVLLAVSAAASTNAASAGVVLVSAKTEPAFIYYVIRKN
jgi:hypothetical protein